MTAGRINQVYEFPQVSACKPVFNWCSTLAYGMESRQQDLGQPTSQESCNQQWSDLGSTQFWTGRANTRSFHTLCVMDPILECRCSKTHTVHSTCLYSCHETCTAHFSNWCIPSSYHFQTNWSTCMPRWQKKDHLTNMSYMDLHVIGHTDRTQQPIRWTLFSVRPSTSTLVNQGTPAP